MEGEFLPLFGNGARFVDHQSGDRGGLLVGQAPVHHAVEVADRDRTVDDHRAVLLAAQTGHREIVFVAYVADDLFQNILKRHQALHVPIFVHNQSEMGLSLAESLQLVFQARRVGHEPDFERDRLQLDLFRVPARQSQGAQKILGVQDADNIIGVFAPQRHARIGRGDDLAHDLGGRQVGVDRQHFGAMDHDVGDRQLLEVEQTAEHVAVGAGDVAFAVHQIDGAFQLLLRSQQAVRLAEADAAHEQRAAHDLFDAIEGRAEQSDEKRHDPDDRQRHAVGIIDRHRFRQDFGEDQQNDRHRSGGVNGAPVAEHRDQKGRQKGR